MLKWFQVNSDANFIHMSEIRQSLHTWLVSLREYDWHVWAIQCLPFCYSPLQCPQNTIFMCAGHGVKLGGESPLWGVLKRSISLGKCITVKCCMKEADGKTRHGRTETW